MLIHFCGGQPSPGPGILSIQHHNPPSGDTRGIFIEQNRAWHATCRRANRGLFPRRFAQHEEALLTASFPGHPPCPNPTLLGSQVLDSDSDMESKSSDGFAASGLDEHTTRVSHKTPTKPSSTSTPSSRRVGLGGKLRSIGTKGRACFMAVAVNRNIRVMPHKNVTDFRDRGAGGDM